MYRRPPSVSQHRSSKYFYKINIITMCARACVCIYLDVRLRRACVHSSCVRAYVRSCVRSFVRAFVCMCVCVYVRACALACVCLCVSS